MVETKFHGCGGNGDDDDDRSDGDGDGDDDDDDKEGDVVDSFDSVDKDSTCRGDINERLRESAGSVRQAHNNINIGNRRNTEDADRSSDPE